MKILVTGMNTAQCVRNYYLQQQLQVVNTQYCLVSALEDMGHDVDQRVVTIGEKLDSYDKVIVFIHNPAGFAGYVYNALWAIYARPDCILSIDDWQSDGIFSGVVGLKDPEVMFRKFIKDSQTDTPEDVEKYTPEFLAAVNLIESKQNTMMIAGVRGGDPTLMVPGYPKELFKSYDPNPYTINRTPENGFGEPEPLFGYPDPLTPEEKTKGWIFVSLMHSRTRKWLKSIKLSGDWEVSYYGSARGEFKSPRLKEPQMCAEYQKYWGCLTPQYFHAGSGFWRPRTLQVANANSILVVSDAEGKLYSPAHIGVKPSDIENMTVAQLADLAAEQKHGYFKQNPLDKSLTKAELSEILNG